MIMRKTITAVISVFLLLALCGCERNTDEIITEIPAPSYAESRSFTDAQTIPQTTADVTETETVTVTETQTIPAAVPETGAPSTISEITETETAANADTLPVVYFTEEISPAALVRIFDCLGKTPGSRTAVKLTTGESSATNYLRPELIADLVHHVGGTIVECNTAYGGVRSASVSHKLLAQQHGFTDVAEVDIMDDEGTLPIPVTDGIHLKENFVGSHFFDYDFFIVLSHFKGHTMAGYGGAIKNASIGIASQKGKCLIHTGGKSSTVMLGGNHTDFLESMCEAAKSVSDYLGNGERIVYINVMNNLSVDCDCVALPAKAEMDDIGILASSDPVALDRACVDLIYEHKDTDGKALVQRIESRNGLHTLDYAEKAGLGSNAYTIISID